MMAFQKNRENRLLGNQIPPPYSIGGAFFLSRRFIALSRSRGTFHPRRHFWESSEYGRGSSFFNEHIRRKNALLPIHIYTHSVLHSRRLNTLSLYHSVNYHIVRVRLYIFMKIYVAARTSFLFPPGSGIGLD